MGSGNRRSNSLDKPFHELNPRIEAHITTNVLLESHQRKVQGKKQKQTLQPAGIPSTTESHKLIRKRLKQELPKARRPIIKNRIELHLPAVFIHLPEDNYFPLHPNTNSPGELLKQLCPDQVIERNLNDEVPLSLMQSEVTWSHRVMFPSPNTMLGAGRVDPFANYPIPVTYCEQWLLDQGA